MLPNFRRSETHPSRSQTTASIAETNTAPSLRPYLSVPRAETPRSVSVIGTDLTIAGNLICKGDVQVDGIVEGDIQGSNVIVGESATVTGIISAEEVVVRGHVVGSVHSRRVMLQTTSQVEGDIYHQSLSIEQGAMFEGKSRRTNDDPRTMLKKPESIGLGGGREELQMLSPGTSDYDLRDAFAAVSSPHIAARRASSE